MKTLISLCATCVLLGATPVVDTSSVPQMLEAALNLGGNCLEAVQTTVQQLASPELWMRIVGAPFTANTTDW